jgi:hypothetical protein
MNVSIIKPAAARQVLLNSKVSLALEAVQWERVNQNQLGPGEMVPVAKSEDLLCLEQVEQLSMAYHFTDIVQKDMDFTALPLMRELKRTFPVLAIIVMVPAHGGFEASLEAMGSFQKMGHYFYCMKQDEGCAPQLLIGVYQEQLQNQFDTDTFLRVFR